MTVEENAVAQTLVVLLPVNSGGLTLTLVPVSPPQADLINQLYQGKLKDYVRCLECGYESWRIDTYLDIPLVIRPFGASQAYGSVVRISRSS